MILIQKSFLCLTLTFNQKYILFNLITSLNKTSNIIENTYECTNGDYIVRAMK
jgi:CTP:phosphocholine cytidylyltransferase-like protein